MEFELTIKKTYGYFFLKYDFIRKIEPFHLRMKHNIIQMTATAGLTVPHSINSIFQYIFDSLGFNPMNSNFDFVFQGLNCLWMVSVTLILNGSPQKIVQGGQITAPRRPIDTRISDDYSIIEKVRKRSIVTLTLWQMAPSCWNQMSSMSSSSIFGKKKIRWAWHGNACHWP